MSSIKKIFIGLAFIAALASCTVKHYSIGMTESEFKRSEKYNLELVEETPKHTVYRRIASIDAQSHPTAYHYYYFNDGVLVRTQLIEKPELGIIFSGR